MSEINPLNQKCPICGQVVVQHRPPCCYAKGGVVANSPFIEDGRESLRSVLMKINSPAIAQLAHEVDQRLQKRYRESLSRSSDVEKA